MTQLAVIAILLAVAACSDSAGPRPEPPLDPGTMRVQISGTVAEDTIWYAFGEFRDLLAADTGEISLLGGQSSDMVTRRNLTLVFPARLDVGSFPVGRYIYGTIPPQPAAYVVIGTSFYASIPGGMVTITDAQYPPRPGLDNGLMSGTMTFQAVRLTAGPGGGGPVETTDTITVRTRFVAHWYHYLYPNVTVSLSGGGPVIGSSLRTPAQSVDDDHGGRFVEWDSDFDLAPGQGIPFEMSQEFRLVAPAVGTYTMGRLTPVTFADPAQWPAAFSALFYRDDPRLALSTGGTLNITKVVAPTDAYYGEIDGTLDAPLALWVNDTTVSADTVHVVAHFAVQLWPLGGIPASGPAPVRSRRLPFDFGIKP